ncbi:MAG: hypothetical protein IJP53_02140 [Synergistaceae bacterium]|nr:hypothetical protein [Synergistaceae bacterium]
MGEYVNSITMIASQVNEDGKEEFYPTSPHEIWVLAFNEETGKYEIPGLASDAEELVKSLTNSEIRTPPDDGKKEQEQEQTEIEDGGSTEYTTPKIEAKAVGISAPTFDYKSDNDITKSVKEELGITSDVDFCSVEDADILGSGDVSVTIQGKQAGAHLDKVKITNPGIYFFRVVLENFYSGMYLYWYPMPQASNVASVAADDEEGKVAFLDKDGNKLEDNRLSEDGQEVVVAAYLEAGKSYSPIIATDAESSTPGSSGSGCEVGGLGIVSLLILAFALRSKQ